VYVFFLMIRSPPKPTLSPYTTLFRSAYVALRLAGDHPDEEHMRAARRVVLDGGGLHGTRVFTRIWLALFGLWRWDEVPALPPELIFLPRWVPLNVYDFACWARQTVVPLTILGALRPARPIGFDVDELVAEHPPVPSHPRSGWARAFSVLD